MSRAQVYTKGGSAPDTFRTSWSEFMKNNFGMNLMVYPHTVVMDKSDAKISFKPAIPAAMVKKAADNDPVYVCVCFKDDTNVWQSAVVDLTFVDFSASVDIEGNDFFETAAAKDFAFTPDDVTAGNVYQVNIVFSNQKINTEAVENAGDLPYTKYGIVSGYVIEVTAQA